MHIVLAVLAVGTTFDMWEIGDIEFEDISRELQETADYGSGSGGGSGSGAAVDCVVSNWGSWGTCSKTCGDATRARNRHIVTEPQYGGAVCLTPLQLSQACTLSKCESDKTLIVVLAAIAGIVLVAAAVVILPWARRVWKKAPVQAANTAQGGGGGGGSSRLWDGGERTGLMLTEARRPRPSSVARGGLRI